MVRKGSGYFEVSLLSRDVGERAAHAAGVWGRYRNVDLISLVSSYIIVPTDQTRLKMFMLELFFFLKDLCSFTIWSMSSFVLAEPCSTLSQA